MKMNLKTISVLIFYGALWGIMEATLGYVLHFAPALIAGSIMFPIAGIILYKAYQKTESAFALVYVGVIATIIKSINLFMPNIHIYKAINPMIAIMLEAVVVAIAIRPLLNSNKVKQYTLITAVSFSWRMLFWGWMGTQYLMTGFVSPYVSDGSFVLTFIVFEGMIGALIFIGLYELQKSVTYKFKLDTKPIASISMFVLAVVLTILL